MLDISKAPPAAAPLHTSASPHNQESGNEWPTGSTSLLNLFKLSLWRAFSTTESTWNSSGTHRTHLISRRYLQRLIRIVCDNMGEGGWWRWWRWVLGCRGRGVLCSDHIRALIEVSYGAAANISWHVLFTGGRSGNLFVELVSRAQR